MEEECRIANIPVVITMDVGVMGGLFNKRKIPILIVRHPNPPRKYSSQIYVIKNDLIMIYSFGRSDAAAELDIYDKYCQGRPSYGLEEKKLYAKFTFGYRPSNVLMEEEINWQSRVFGVFKEIFDVV